MNNIMLNNNRCSNKMECCLCDATLFHHCSCDKVTRPTVFEASMPALDPMQECSANDFYRLAGFWPDQLKEIIKEMTLMPDAITRRRTGICSNKRHQ